MKTKLKLITLFIVLSTSIFGQTSKSVDGYLKELPKNLELNKNIEQKYLMTTDYIDHDMFGKILKKTRIIGEYTTGLHDGFVRWNNVNLYKWNNSLNAFGDAQKQEFMEGFTYVPSEKMMNPDAFNGFPANGTQFQNLVWDVMGFEVFAYEYFDSLELNKEFVATTSNREIDLAGTGTFENKNIRLTWVGISKVNDEICAIIEYTAMDNPLQVTNDFISIKGRSHYWGNVYVSLEDKQIEFGNLYEDVIMEVKLAGQENVKQMNTTRFITFEKIK